MVIAQQKATLLLSHPKGFGVSEREGPNPICQKPLSHPLHASATLAAILAAEVSSCRDTQLNMMKMLTLSSIIGFPG
ncbi:hypothetical protein DMENIID0001_061840 [Sergentomyia squamirostris]